MTTAFPFPTRKIKNPARLMQQGVWLLLVIAVSLLVIMRTSGTLGKGSLWILGCAVAAFLLSLTMRDVVRKLGYRNTQDKIVKDVKTFLETQPPLEVRQPVYRTPAVIAEVREEAEELIPRQATSFATMVRELTLHTPSDDLVVFDAISPRTPIALHMDFYPVMTPVVSI